VICRPPDHLANTHRIAALRSRTIPVINPHVSPRFVASGARDDNAEDTEGRITKALSGNCDAQQDVGETCGSNAFPFARISQCPLQQRCHEFTDLQRQIKERAVGARLDHTHRTVQTPQRQL